MDTGAYAILPRGQASGLARCLSVHAEFEDTGSSADLIIDRTGEQSVIRVANVESKVTGDMRRILDDATQQLGIYGLRFMVPLTEFGSPIEERLAGFEKVSETVEGPDGPVEVEVLSGTWEPKRG
jgi:hypothetical protein